MNIPIIKQVPPESVKGKILFAGTDGRFYNAAGQELKPTFSPAMRSNRPNMHSAYPKMRSFGNRLCHHLIWETFVGPRTPGMEIDHINGNKLDWSLDNLRQITPMENVRCARYLRELRKLIPNHWLTFQTKDYLRFYAMPFEDFKAMLNKFTNH
jgi:hypothetical protein